MSPKELIQDWINAFNTADISTLTDLYHDNAINHQVANMPVVGKLAIQQMFIKEFTYSMNVFIPENIFEDKEWCIVEWKDPTGLRGCGIFHVQEDKIIYQRGYWDKLSFLKMHNINQ